jgi:hypothetical protein
LKFTIKMKITNLLTRFSSSGLMAAVLFMASCQDEEKRLTVQDTQDISEEALTDSYYQDMDDMGSVAIGTPSDSELSGGRKASTIVIEDDRFECNGVVVTIEPDETSTVDIPKGKITVDFGTLGCTDAKGNVRKGKIIYAYYKRRFQPGSTVVTTTENYYINGIKLEGVRTSTNIAGSTEEAPKFNVVLTDGKATFADATVATRESDITWSWQRGASVTLDKLVIDKVSTASGTTRGGRTYEVSLTEDLVYNRGCFFAVDGVKRYIIDGSKEIIIDYGVGDCKTISVTVNGITRSLTVN